MTYQPGFPNAPQQYDWGNESQFRAMIRRAFAEVSSPSVLEGSVQELYDGVFGDTLIHDGDQFVASTQFLVDMQFNAKIQFFDITNTQQVLNEIFQEDATTSQGFGGGGSGTGVIAQTTSGKLIRRGDKDFLSTPGDEWDATEWSGFGGATLSVEGTGKLQIGGSETDEWHGGIFTPLAARAKQHIQAIVFFGTGGTSESYLGVSALATSSGGTPSMDGFASVKQAGAGSSNNRFSLVEVSAGATGTLKEIENAVDQSPGTGWQQTGFNDHSPASEASRVFVGYCGPNDLLGDGQTELDLSSPSTGQVAFVKGKAGSAGLARMTKMFVSADRYVSVQNLPTGYKAKLYDSGDTLLASATESGGTATVDVADVWCEDIAYLRVDNASDVEQARYAIVNEVMYGGTVYDYNLTTLPSGSVRETAAGVKKAFMDFSQYTVSSGLPSDWKYIGSGGSPVFAIANDPSEGNYLKVTGQGFNEQAVLYQPWDGQCGREVEMLARVWVNAAVANRRIGGPGFLIWGTDSTDLNGMAGGVYMRATDDFESTVVEYVNGAGVVPNSADLQEAEQTGVWMWIRWRRDNYNTTPIPDAADTLVKAWYGTLDDEPAGWDSTLTSDPQGIEVPASGIGWFLADLAYSGEQRIAYLSWSSDPADPPDEPAPIPSDADWLTIQNPVDDETRLQIKARTAAFTDPVAAAVSLVRENSSQDRMTLLFRSDGVADEYQMHFEKTGAATYLPFYVRWDTTDALELLSPDDAGGPSWNFQVQAAFADQILLITGGAATPSWSFTAAPTTGMYLDGGGQLGVSIAGITHARFDDSAPFLQVIGDGSNEILRLDSQLTTGSPYLSFAQASTVRGSVGFDDTRNSTWISSDYGPVDFYAGSAGVFHLVVKVNYSVPHVHIDGRTGQDEILRLDHGDVAGNPELTFYQQGTLRSLIRHLDTGDNFDVTSNYGAIRIRAGTAGTPTTRLTIRDSGPQILISAGANEALRINHSSLTGSPYISLYQDGTRRSYIQHLDSGDSLLLVSEYGTIALRPGTAGTPGERILVSDTTPHLHIKGKTGIDEMVRIDHGDAAGDPFVGIYQSGTYRGGWGYVDDHGGVGVDEQWFGPATTTGYLTLYAGSAYARLRDGTPVFQIRGTTGDTRLLDLISADVAGDVRLSFFQTTTSRGYIEWNDTAGDLLIKAEEASSRINLDAPSGVHVLAAIEIDGDLDHDGTNIGFFGTAPTTQQTITGSRGGNAALASLLTGLANYGAIVDSTTA